jgi:hypothetical protein
MDELNLDTFLPEHDAWADAVFAQAQNHIRRCFCNRSGAIELPCARCTLIQSLFPRRQFDMHPPKERKSAPETASSRARANPASPQGLEHTPPRQAVDEKESEGLPVEWDEEWDEEWEEECDEEWEDGRLDLGDSNPEECDRILDMKRHITLKELEMACNESLGMVATSDTEPKQNSCPTFSSDALRLVWGDRLV